MTTTPETPTAMEDTVVFDADVHVAKDPAVVAQYLDAPYDRKLTIFEEMGDQSYRPTSGWDILMGGKIPPDRSVPDAAETHATLCQDFGIDHPVLNVLGGLSTVPDTDFAVALMSAYNDMLLERFLDERDHFYGLATVAPQDPEAAVAEIDRIGDEEQIVGVLLASTSPNDPLGDPVYDPIYRAVEDHDLMVAYHGAAASGFVTQFPIQNAGFETFMSVHFATHPWAQMATLTSLVEHGTMVKFPDINFLFQEAGIGWVPYTMYRLNKECSMRRSEVPMLERTPEAHIRESCYFTTQPIGEPDDPSHVRQFFEMVGYDSVLFSSDYPHWDFDHPSELGKHVRSLDADRRDQLLRDTPAECFGIAV